MRTPAFGFLLLTAFAAGSAHAQMYKIVGPDGKISYSDRPPVEQNAKVMMMNGAKAVPMASAPAPAAAAAAPAVKDAKGDQAKSTLKALAANPGLVAGIASVLDTSELVSQSVQICSKLPNPKSYLAAGDAWSLRNGAVLKQHRGVFDELYPSSDQASLKKGITERVGKTMEPVASANEPSRIKWCDKSMEEIRAGKMDLAGKEGIDALMAYKKPAPVK